MRLTGKCLMDFRVWYADKYIKTFTVNYVQMVVEKFGGFIYGKLDAFDCSPDEMRYGVYVDFFDSVKLDVDVMRYADSNDWQVCVGDDDFMCDNIKRSEVREVAIKKANEIYNSR